MKIRNKIRQEASLALDVLIPEGKWEKYVDMLDRQGTFTKKKMMEMILILCKQVEVLEILVEDLYTKQELEKK